MARKPCTSDCGSFHSYRLPPLFLPSPAFLSRPSLAPPSTPSSRELNEKLAPLLALLSATFLIKRFHPPPPEKYQNSGSPVTSQFRWNNEFPLEIVAANLRKRRSSLYRGYSDRAHRFETFQILRPDTGSSPSPPPRIEGVTRRSRLMGCCSFVTCQGNLPDGGEPNT